MGQNNTFSCWISYSAETTRNQQMSWLGRQVAAASPETGSQLVKCQRTFRHWIATELLPAAE